MEREKEMQENLCGKPENCYGNLKNQRKKVIINLSRPYMQDVSTLGNNFPKSNACITLLKI